MNPGSGELAPATDVNKVNLEHVLPKTYVKELGITKPEHDDLLMRLGNQTIMQTDWNRDLGNLPFEQKRQTYSRSELGITSELAGYSEFKRRQIDERQKRMAVAAPGVWSLKLG